MDENKELNVNKEEVDKASFADVNYGKEEAAEEKAAPKKKKKSRIYGIIIAAVSIIVLLTALFVFLGEKNEMGLSKKNEVGLSNRFNSPIGVTVGDYLYHSNIAGTKFIKTDIETKESEVLSEKSVAFFSKYKGDIYYYDAMAEAIYRYNEKGEDVLIYAGSAYYQQFQDGYIYFLEPNSNYGGIVKRVSVKGGEAETVLSAPCAHFAINKKDIVYYDPTINSLLINKIKDTMADTDAKTSADLKSVVLAEQNAVNINVVGDDVFFTDGSANYKMQKVNILTGEISDINYDSLGEQINVYGDYLFYINPYDRHIYRINLDGSDIRDITGSAFLEVAGLTIYKNRILFYALMGEYDENMQMQPHPYIVVADFDGNLLHWFNPDETTAERTWDIPYEGENKTEE